MRLSAVVVPYPRVWASRPAFINRLNQMNEEVRASVGVRVRGLGLGLGLGSGLGLGLG